MKKLIILIFIFVAVSLTAITFDLSFAMRTPKADSLAIDYELGARCSIDSLFSAEIELERQEGEYYRNIELFAWQYWKFLQLSGKYISIQEDDLNVCSVDLRVKYKTHSVGIAETWDLHPETMLVVGESIVWKFGIPYLIPIEFMGITNVYTGNFRNYYTEAEITFDWSISSIMSLYIRHKQRYYDEYNWTFKFGLKIKL